MQEMKHTSYTYEGQLSTDKDDKKLRRILINHFRFGLELKLELIPAQTGNGTMKMYTNPKPFLSVDS